MSTLIVVSSEVGVRSWLVARWRVVVPVSAVVVLALVATIAIAVPALNSSGEADAEGFDCAQRVEPSFEAATPKARACEVDVEVTSERTPWSTTWATADGPIRLEQSVSPSRTSVTGEWTDIDTTLQVDAESGMVAPVAPVYEIELNDGTERPLGAITREGKRLEVGSPVQLPVPNIEDGQAVYEIADGVRLIVTVNEDGTGFFPVFELATPDAAGTLRTLLAERRTAVGGAPAGGGNGLQLAFPVTMPAGLHLEADGNAANVVDELGETHFVVPPPVMWDSAASELRAPEHLQARAATGATGAVDDRLAAPLPGDQVAQMDLHVEPTSVVVDPNEAMLTAPETVWPVYLDPGFSGRPPSEWIAVRTGGYTDTLYQWGDISTTMQGEGSGRCNAASCNTVFTQRLLWEFNGLDALRSMVGANIISASFAVNGVHSYSCTATTTDLHVLLEGITAGQTWGSHNWHEWTRYSSRTEYHSDSCGNKGYKSFDATSAVKHYADGDWPTLPLALKSRDESTMTGWKRFRHDALLSVEYNRPPDPPSRLQITNPMTPACSTSQQLINSLTPTLSAVVNDPDGENVAAHFQVFTKSGTAETEVWSVTNWAAHAPNTRAFATVAAGKLIAGTAYFWRATAAGSGGQWSGWGPTCQFKVDVTPPAKPTVEPVRSGVEAVYDDDDRVERGGVEMMGKFIVGPNGSNDVIEYSYSFGDPAALKPVGETRIIEFDPKAAGPVTLHVRSKDLAGNLSDRVDYQIVVASPIEDAVWKLDETGGSSAPGSGPKQAGPLKISGAGWVKGPHQLFGSRDDDWALTFDGLDDVAVAAGPVLDTKKSFTVSAHVLLPGSRPPAGDYTALSQDGLTQSAFQLGYRSDCGAGAACWSFSMPDTSDGATISAATTGTVTADEWVHLVGEHDATNKTVRLWVCEVGTPANPKIGDPVASAPVTRGGAAWQSPGAFTVGRGQTAGNAASLWPGRIDNVRVFSGQIVDASKLRRLCQGAEAEDFGEGAEAFTAVDPTVSER
ncbi:LamG-like jellyroll fold domain-containing protein [Agromyces subbeticus]|uniref:LamG-like jellyroll fold domain-containing protein n=1 Tax=Agromyces subbeticus TaxID=293890 RepID=UPI0003B33409|nr:LamG-like jellyroll fold domain-containing protein [Agromyces subbeticus]